jgi:hypothetical protein
MPSLRTGLNTGTGLNAGSGLNAGTVLNASTGLNNTCTGFNTCSWLNACTGLNDAGGTKSCHGIHVGGSSSLDARVQVMDREVTPDHWFTTRLSAVNSLYVNSPAILVCRIKIHKNIGRIIRFTLFTYKNGLAVSGTTV